MLQSPRMHLSIMLCHPSHSALLLLQLILLCNLLSKMSVKLLLTEIPIPPAWMILLLEEQPQMFLTAMFSRLLIIHISVLMLPSTGRPLNCGVQNWAQLQLRSGVVSKVDSLILPSYKLCFCCTPQITLPFSHV